jgi:hypothetical protein
VDIEHAMRAGRHGVALGIVQGLIGSDKAEAEKALPMEQLHTLRVALVGLLGWDAWVDRLTKRRPLDFPSKLQTF